MKKAIIRIFLVGVAISLIGCSVKPASDVQGSDEDLSDPQESFSGVCERASYEFGNTESGHFHQIFDTRKYFDQVFMGIKRSDNANYIKYMSGVMARGDIIQNIDHVYSDFAGLWNVHDLDVSEEKASCILISDYSESGVAIVELHLVDRDGKIKVTNWYDHITESYASDQLRQFSIDIKTLSESGNEISQEMKSLQDFVRLTGHPKPLEVSQAYSKLDKAYRAKEAYALAYVVTANRAGGEQYLAALDNLDAHFSQTGKYGLLLMDYYVLKGRYDDALASIDRAEERIGANVIFDIFRMGVYQLTEDNKKYYQSAVEALEKNIGVEDVYWSLLDTFVQYEQYADAVLVLDVIKDFFGYQITQRDIAGIPEYQFFAESREFSDWLN